MMRTDKRELHGKLTAHALFLDYTPRAPFEALYYSIVALWIPVRNGIENLLIELAFIIPYVQRALFFAMRYLAAFMRQIPRSSFIRNRWVIVFLFAMFALFY